MLSVWYAQNLYWNCPVDIYNLNSKFSKNTKDDLHLEIPRRLFKNKYLVYIKQHRMLENKQQTSAKSLKIWPSEWLGLIGIVMKDKDKSHIDPTDFIPIQSFNAIIAIYLNSVS